MVRSLHRLASFEIAFVVREIEHAAGEFDARLDTGPWRGWVFGLRGQRPEPVDGRGLHAGAA
jgi:hypothetical protein